MGNPAIVQSKFDTAATAASTAHNLVLTSVPTTGNLIVLAVVTLANNVTPATPTGYSAVGGQSGNGSSSSNSPRVTFYTKTVASSADQTVTIPSQSVRNLAGAWEISGSATAGTFRLLASAATGAAVTTKGVTGSPTFANAIPLVVSAINDASTANGAIATYTRDSEVADATSANTVDFFHGPLTAATGSQTVTETWTGNSTALGGAIAALYVYPLNGTKTVNASSRVRPGDTYGNAIDQDKPIYWARLQETSGTSALDTSANKITTTIGSGVTLGAPGLLKTVSEKSMTVPGPGAPTNVIGSARSALLERTTNVSGEMWVQFPSAPGACNLISAGWGGAGHPSYGWILGTDPTGTTFGIYPNSGGTNLNGATQFELGKPYHVVWTYDGATLNIYVNGVLDGSMALTGSITGYDGVSGLYIGDAGTNSIPAGTAIAEVAIYGTALSQAQVTAHYVAGHGLSINAAASIQMGPYGQAVLADGAVGYWPLNDGVSPSTVANDVSGNLNNGTYGSAITTRSVGLLAGDDANDYAALYTTTVGVTNQVTASQNARYESTTAHSMELMVQFPAGWVPSNNNITIYGYGAYIGAYNLYINSSGNFVYYADNSAGNSVIGSTVAQPGTIYHIVGTYDGTTLKLYVNGVLDGSAADSAAITGYSGTAGWVFGEISAGSSPAWKLAEAAFYRTALSAAQVQNHYNLATWVHATIGAGAEIAGTGSTTTTATEDAGARIQATPTQAIGCGAIIARATSIAIAAGAIVKATSSRASAAASRISAVGTLPLGAGASIVVLPQISIGAGASIGASSFAPIAAGAIIQATPRPTISGAAVVSVVLSSRTNASAVIQQSGDYSIDASSRIQVTVRPALSGHAIVVQSSSINAAAGARISNAAAPTLGAGAVIQATVRPVITAAAVIRRNAIQEIPAAANITAPSSDSIFATSRIQGRATASMGAGARLLNLGVTQIPAGALVTANARPAIGAGAIILVPATESALNGAAIVRANASASLAAGAEIIRHASSSLPAAAIVSATPTRSIAAGARIIRTAEQSVAAGSYVVQPASSSIGAGARLTRTTATAVGAGCRISATPRPNIGAGAVISTKARLAIDAGAITSASVRAYLGAASLIARTTGIGIFGKSYIVRTDDASIGAGAWIVYGTNETIDAAARIVATVSATIDAGAAIVRRPNPGIYEMRRNNAYALDRATVVEPIYTEEWLNPESLEDAPEEGS